MYRNYQQGRPRPAQSHPEQPYPYYNGPPNGYEAHPHQQWPANPQHARPYPQRDCENCGAFTHPTSACPELMRPPHEPPYGAEYDAYPAKRQKYDQSYGPRHHQPDPRYAGPQGPHPPPYDYQYPPEGYQDYPPPHNHPYVAQGPPPHSQYANHRGHPEARFGRGRPYRGYPSYSMRHAANANTPQNPQHSPTSAQGSHNSDQLSQSDPSHHHSPSHSGPQSPPGMQRVPSKLSNPSPVSDQFRTQLQNLEVPTPKQRSKSQSSEGRPGSLHADGEHSELEEGETKEDAMEQDLEIDERDDLEVLTEAYEVDYDTKVVFKAPKPVGQPLPCRLNDAQKIAPLPGPSTKEIASISRYFNSVNKFLALRSVRDAEYWDTMKIDPVFQTISENCDKISLKQLKANHGWHRPNFTFNFQSPIPLDHFGTPDFRWTPRTNYPQPPFDISLMSHPYPPDTPFFANGGPGMHVPAHVKRPEALPPQQTDEEVEDHLTALGVTGPSKPLSAHAPSSAPIEEIPDRQIANVQHNSGSMEARDAPQISPRNSGHFDHPHPPPYHHDPSGVDFYHNRPPQGRYENGNRRFSYTNDSYDNQNYYRGNQISPSIPAPPHQPSPQNGDATDSRPTSNRKPSNDKITENSHPKPYSSASRPSYKTESSRNTSSSRSPSEERQRQDDDDTPKHKKKQPRVDEAYSRRW